MYIAAIQFAIPALGFMNMDITSTYQNIKENIMKIDQIRIQMEKSPNEDAPWKGIITVNGEEAKKVIGWLREGEHGPFFFLNEDVEKDSLPEGEYGESFGLVAIKEGVGKNDKPYTKFNCREFKFNGLCAPVTGFGRTSKDDSQFCEMGFDSWYYENQKEHWEGKRDYVLEGEDPTIKQAIEEEVPF